MVRLVALGCLAALFFSSTFILNRAMSLEGGHWAWSASLRFGYMLLFISVLLLITKGAAYLAALWRLYRTHWVFWTTAGSIGFGVFYALLCLSADHAAGWVVATTWEITILCTPLVLLGFGKRVPLKGIAVAVVIFAGIVLVNSEQMGAATLPTTMPWWWAVIPIVIAAFAYPFGLQLVWEASQGGHGWIPAIRDPLMQDGFAKVLLLTLGSMPFWLGLLLVIVPPAPSTGQLVSTAWVALLSGVIATTVFLSARHPCRQPHEIAAVDASQAMEVVFSLIGEVWLLHGLLPSAVGWLGIALTVLGLMAYTRLQAA